MCPNLAGVPIEIQGFSNVNNTKLNIVYYCVLYTLQQHQKRCYCNTTCLASKTAEKLEILKMATLFIAKDTGQRTNICPCACVIYPCAYDWGSLSEPHIDRDKDPPMAKNDMQISIIHYLSYPCSKKHNSQLIRVFAHSKEFPTSSALST